jgi:hypothetical protein
MDTVFLPTSATDLRASDSGVESMDTSSDWESITSSNYEYNERGGRRLFVEICYQLNIGATVSQEMLIRFQMMGRR